MAHRDIVVIGASAGGVEAMLTLVADLPRNFPAAVFLVIHIPATAPSVLPLILTRRGKLPASHPTHGTAISRGHIYVAPPDHHLLLGQERMHVIRGPTENGHRPAVDPLFRSAASAYGNRVIGVVLSGNLDDGTAGLMAIKRMGGTAIAQDPDDAAYAGMPSSAAQHVPLDRTVRIADLGQVLTQLVAEPITPVIHHSTEIEWEVAMDAMNRDAMTSDHQRGVPSGFSCPECNGSLWEIREDELVRYRCRVGHAYSPESLLDEERKAVEVALWTALRALEENAALLRRLERRAEMMENTKAVASFAAQAAEIELRAAAIRQVIVSSPGLPTPSPGSSLAPE
jgi:two-component system, chemotaxis family, protein-glutamate methylesterase/glutaminase